MRYAVTIRALADVSQRVVVHARDEDEAEVLALRIAMEDEGEWVYGGVVDDARLRVARVEEVGNE